jgi:redox-sensing transcriptional repressor
MYLRILREMDLTDNRFISSAELGERAGVTSAQVRKDLAMFGEFGKQGVGYQALNLKNELMRILNTDKTINVAILGVGELGTALARYVQRRFENDHDYPFRLTALFDVDPHKIGLEVEGVAVDHLDSLPARVRERRIKIGVVAVPAPAAQEVTELAISAGIRAFLDFAPVKLKVPSHVRVHYSDVSLELHQLAFFL